MGPEATLQRQILTLCKAQGVWTCKVDGSRSLFDLLLIAPSGRVGFVEVKSPGGDPRRKLRASQLRFEQTLIAYHIPYLITNDLADVAEFLGGLKNSRDLLQ